MIYMYIGISILIIVMRRLYRKNIRELKNQKVDYEFIDQVRSERDKKYGHRTSRSAYKRRNRNR